jgi:hypothetical protein
MTNPSNGAAKTIAYAACQKRMWQRNEKLTLFTRTRSSSSRAALRLPLSIALSSYKGIIEPMDYLYGSRSPHRQHHQRRYFVCTTPASASSSSGSAWWNPFSSSGIRDTDPRLASARTKSDSDSEQPRRVNERKDLTLLLLAADFRKASLLEDQQQHKTSQSSTTTSSSSSSSREHLIDIAFAKLDEMEVDSKTILQLRHALQSELEPQVVYLLGKFKAIDEDLLLFSPPASSSDSSEDDSNYSRIDGYLDEMLQLEWDRTIDELANPKPQRAPKGADPRGFLTLKRGAMETLLDRRRWNRKQIHPYESVDGQSTDKTTDTTSTITPSPGAWVDADEFGYHETIDAERNRLIRYYQSINVCRAAKLRDANGFAVIALQSSIPGAGRGVYVDGYARAGSILAFQPGLVWAKENLVSLSVDEERLLEKNDMYQMSLRPDDFLIDSRKSPYTVLTEEGSNSMALGHIVNHPTPTNPPNARSAMFNFTGSMGLEEKGVMLKRYIPNTYARPRNLSLLGSLWDRDVIDMHSMVLIATRDICNEEIFYDYRLASNHLPLWYHPVKDTAYMDSDEEEEVKEEEENKDLGV